MKRFRSLGLLTMALFVLAAPAAQAGNEVAPVSAFDSLSPTGAVSLGGGLSVATAADQTLACTDAALTSAFASGGSYTVAANCTLEVTTPLTLAAGTSLSIDAGSYTIDFFGTDPPNQFATIDGNLTLTGVELNQFYDNGANGTAGTNGTTGGTGGAGGDGGPGGNGAIASGGALVINSTGTVTLDDDTFASDQANGGNAGPGGSGGTGGSGGDGADGGAGGNGGSDGNSASAYGGAISNAGTLDIESSTFNEDQAQGGSSGFGGVNYGGDGGPGGASDTGIGGDGGRGGDGGDPGISGSAYGGAIYNTGSLNIAGTTFSYDVASSGFSQGGFGGTGGIGGNGEVGGNGGDGGNGGPSGPVPTAVGGAVYSTDAFTVVGGTTTHNFAEIDTNYSGSTAIASSTGSGGPGGQGGYGDNNANGTTGSTGSPLQQTNVDGTSSNNDYYPDPNGGGLTISPTIVGEPVSGSVTAAVTVTLTPAQTTPVTVDYTTVDGTATAAHGDYTSESGTLTFAADQTSATISIPINATGLTGDAGFGVQLSDPSGASINIGEATVEITNQPVLSGTVEDRSGHGIGGVTVAVTGSSSQTATTSSTGQYSLELPQGNYTVTAEPADGRYIPQTGGGCTVSGDSCTIDMTGSGGEVADFDAALRVDSVSFQQEDLTSGALVDVPSSGTYDGNWVKVTATISNTGSSALSTGVSFGRAASATASTTTSLQAAQSLPSNVTVPAGGTATVSFDWNTTGSAWTDQGKADSDHIIRATTDLTPGYGQSNITVRPKPMILVHGLNSDASTWSDYAGFAHTYNPDWETFAVGDAKEPGVMNTTPITTPGSGRGNTIYQNAQQEAEYIQGVRNTTGAWHVDIVAHSMGGLISRQYIDDLMPSAPPDGQPVVSHLVMLGTPNEGSPCAELLSAVEGSAASNPTLQLTTTYMAAFDDTVTDRHGVPFSLLAGDIHLPTCDGPSGDSVVPVSSALWNLTDTTVVTGLWHTDMTSSSYAFTDWVVPHLAIGPASGTIPSDQRTHTPTQPRAKKKPVPVKKKPAPVKKKTCKAKNGSIPDLSAGGTFTATRTGATVTIPVSHSSSFVLSVFAPDAAMALVNPSGKTIQSIRPGSVAATGGLFQTLTIKHPGTGRWRLKLTTVRGIQPGAYALIEHGQSASLSASLTITKQTLKTITAIFKQRGHPISGKLTAVIDLPSGKHVRATLKAIRGHRGEYRATLKLKAAAGTLPLQVVVTANGGGQHLTTAVSQSQACN